MRGRTVLSGVAAAVTAAVLLGACTRSGSEGSGGGSGGGSVAGRPAAPTAGGLRGGVAYDASGGDAQGGGGTSAEGKAGTAPTDLTPPQALIRVADLSVEVAKPATVQTQADRAGQIAIDAGGSAYSDNRSLGDAPTANLTLKVPPDRLGATLAKLAELGTETARDVSTENVTQQVADIDSRVRSARDAVASMRLLFDRATKLSDIITIESELNQREADLESLQAQQRALAAQVSMATVRLSLSAAEPGANDRGGFLGGLSDGWHNFTTAAGWVATAVGVVLPFAVVLALLAAPGVLLWRRRPHPVLPPPSAPGDAT